jgi:hypothetical protein
MISVDRIVAEGKVLGQLAAGPSAGARATIRSAAGRSQRGVLSPAGPSNRSRYCRWNRWLGLVECLGALGRRQPVFARVEDIGMVECRGVGARYHRAGRLGGLGLHRGGRGHKVPNGKPPWWKVDLTPRVLTVLKLLTAILAFSTALVGFLHSSLFQ